MKKIFLSGFVALSLMACTTTNPREQLEQQAMLGLNWVQQSGEYRALSHQAFNMATLAFDQATSKKTKAVVVDLDETLIDNSPYAAWRIRNNQAYTPENFNRWVNARQAPALAGAVAFNNHVHDAGGKMFYVSNRFAPHEIAPTIDNMRQLGFKGVDEKSIMLRTDKSNKSPRFDAISQQGYDIVLFVGDNLNDFGDAFYKKDNAQRRALVEHNKHLFGTRFIMLPNPNYGDWEGALGQSYWQATDEGKLQMRNNALKAWDGR